MRLSLIIQFVVLLAIGCTAGIVHSRLTSQATSRKLIASYLRDVSQRDAVQEKDDSGTGTDGTTAEAGTGSDENPTQGTSGTGSDTDANGNTTAPVEAGGAGTEPGAGQEALIDPTQWPLEITLEQAFAAYQSEKMAVIFIDARDQEDYEAGHVSRALHVTNEMFMDEKLLPQDIGFWPEDQLIITYCTGGDCDLSHMVKTRLEGYNYTNVHIMTDGYDAWAEAGHPVTEGSEP